MAGRTRHRPLTQRVGDARLHVVGADVADPVLVLRLGQHHDANVPEGVDGDLVGRTLVTVGRGAAPDPRPPRDSHSALTSMVWGSLSVIPPF